MKFRNIMAIDPGASGCIAWRDKTGSLNIEKMPSTVKDIFIVLSMAALDGHMECMIEKVGGYMPGNSGPASVKFARHCGHLDMGLIANSIRIQEVTPNKWMKKFLGTVPKEKKDRKNAIKAKAQQLYPDVNVTLWNADALGILWYLEQQHQEDPF